MGPTPQLLEASGHGAAIVAYTLVAAIYTYWRPRAVEGAWLGAVAWLTLCSSITAAYGALAESDPAQWTAPIDTLRLGAWALFLRAFVLGPSQRALDRGRFPSAVALVLVLVIVAVAIIAAFVAEAASAARIAHATALALIVIGFAYLALSHAATGDRETLYRPLWFAILAILAVDAAVAATSLAAPSYVAPFALLKGFAAAAAAPSFLFAGRSHPEWGYDLFVSRQAATSIIGAVITAALIAAAIVAGIVLADDAPPAGAALIGVALVGVAVLSLRYLWSPPSRRRIGVILTKHFYRNRYDYRDVLLRLIRTLTNKTSEPLGERGVRALAEIIGSPAGALWRVSGATPGLEGCAAWNAPVPESRLSADDALTRFLAETGWVLDTEEYAQDRERYANAFEQHPEIAAIPSIIVPLLHDAALVGFVRLQRPRDLGKMTFEDHDLLKTAGTQVAIFLVQEQAQEELYQTRQFEAFAKFTAFLMHDLKNLMSQQELVVVNARKFRDRPEFIDDAIRTMESSVKRMRSLLERLQDATSTDRLGLIDLPRLVRDVCITCADRTPWPTFRCDGNDTWVAMDRDKLAMAVTHAVRNAQDATATSGRIEVTLTAEADVARIVVADTGVGMDAAFVRNRLFKPFDSTKGAQGMGIGAYQIRETLRLGGGDVEVKSALGEGTRLTLTLPRVRANRETSDSAPARHATSAQASPSSEGGT